MLFIANRYLSQPHFDGDLGLTQKEFDAFANATYDGPGGYPASSKSTLFLRKLLENESFKVRFLKRFRHLLRTEFASELTKQFNDEALETLRGEIPNQAVRFNFPDSLQIWEDHMAGINTFLETRERLVNEHLRAHYLSDDFSLALNAIFPSPAQNEIHVRVDFDKTTSTAVQIFDLAGRLQVSFEQLFGAGASELAIPIHLPSDVYTLKIGAKSRKFVFIN